MTFYIVHHVYGLKSRLFASIPTQRILKFKALMGIFCDINLKKIHFTSVEMQKIPGWIYTCT